MKYEKGHKELTRLRILDVAGKRFRKQGIATAALADVMKNAGLTNGAFYNHFESKEGLVREVLAHLLEQQHAQIQDSLSRDGLEAVVRNYLGSAHRDKYETSCPSACLVAEVGRHPKRTRNAYSTRVVGIIDLVAESLPGEDDAPARQRKAGAIVALLLGSLQLARAVTDPGASDAILEGGIEAALQLARV